MTDRFEVALAKAARALNATEEEQATLRRAAAGDGPDLPEFLLERIDEDRAVALAATQSVQWWDWHGRHGHKEAKVRAHEDPYIALNVANGDASHIARWDPARVLAECDAKRQLVELHKLVEGFKFVQDPSHPYVGRPVPVVGCDHDGWIQPVHDGDPVSLTEGPCPTLCLLALPYADHPDYRQEWRP